MGPQGKQLKFLPWIPIPPTTQQDYGKRRLSLAQKEEKTPHIVLILEVRRTPQLPMGRKALGGQKGRRCYPIVSNANYSRASSVESILAREIAAHTGGS